MIWHDPCVQPPLPAPGALDGPASGPVAAPVQRTGDDVLRVLLVEDDEGDAFLVQDLLQDAPVPVDVVHVRSLAEARPELARGCSCVLLDLGLPDASGLDAIAGVLASAGTAAVVCLTGSDDEQRGAAAVAAGAQDYLVKGTVDGALLHRAIRYAVQRRRADEQARQLVATRLRAEENARLERGLLPLPVTRDPRMSVTTRYRPGRGALLGGDFYDVVEVPDGQLLVLVGDVAGHGPDEAALGVCLRIAWRTLVLAGTPVEQLLPVVEDVLVRERRSEEVFTTAVMLAVAPDRRSARMWSAGHPDPVLLDPQPRQLPEADHGPALGLFPGGEWHPRHLDLPPAWRLLLFTDGLIEGWDGPGGERLGTTGLERVLDEVGAGDGGPSAELLDRVLERAGALNGEPLSDDVAVLLVAAATEDGA